MDFEREPREYIQSLFSEAYSKVCKRSYIHVHKHKFLIDMRMIAERIHDRRAQHSERGVSTWISPIREDRLLNRIPLSTIRNEVDRHWEAHQNTLASICEEFEASLGIPLDLSTRPKRAPVTENREAMKGIFCDKVDRRKERRNQ